MRKLLVRTLPAFALCAALAVAALDRGWLRLPSAANVISDVPVMSDAEAQAHRASRYAQIASIEELFGLPGQFARMEALYALAGRSDSGAVQNLIHQANGIADLSARRDTLLVLFTRLTELDPKSALALSRTPAFAADPVCEREVWRRWGERDLDGALQHAATQGSESRRNFAAQALMAAYGYWGNGQTARIAELLDAEPDTRTRSARLDELASSDPTAAIAYVHTLESPLHRRQAAAHLGHLLGRSGIGAADRFAALFQDRALAEAFQNAAAQAAAEVDPAGTLEILLAEAGEDGSRLAAAFTAMAARDLGQALTWFERVQDSRQHRLVGGALAEQLARQDPLRALAWAREVDKGLDQEIYLRALTALSETRPDIAMADARALDQRMQRLSAMMRVARTVAQHDPHRALALLDGIDSPDDREMMVEGVVMNWLNDDPEAALGWMLASDAPGRSDFFAGAAHLLARRDVEAAIRLLPRIDKEHASIWRQQIAANLAAQRSAAEARQFIAQYEGTPEYPQMMSALIQGLAHSDAVTALDMLNELPAGMERQRLYSGVLMQYAEQDPEQAVASLASVDDEALRTNLTAQLVGQWARSDPAAAERWTADLPPGKHRDMAIMGVSSRWTDITPSRRLMIESLDNAELRLQVVSNTLFRVAGESLEKAERLLREINLPPEQKEAVRQQLEMVSKHSSSPYIGVW